MKRKQRSPETPASKVESPVRKARKADDAAHARLGGGGLRELDVEGVYQFALDADVRAEDAAILKKQQIDGEELLMTTKENFVSMGMPWGSAGKLLRAVEASLRPESKEQAKRTWSFFDPSSVADKPPHKPGRLSPQELTKFESVFRPFEKVFMNRTYEVGSAFLALAQFNFNTGGRIYRQSMRLPASLHNYGAGKSAMLSAYPQLLPYIRDCLLRHYFREEIAKCEPSPVYQKNQGTQLLGAAEDWSTIPAPLKDLDMTTVKMMLEQLEHLCNDPVIIAVVVEDYDASLEYTYRQLSLRLSELCPTSGTVDMSRTVDMSSYSMVAATVYIQEVLNRLRQQRAVIITVDEVGNLRGNASVPGTTATYAALKSLRHLFGGAQQNAPATSKPLHVLFAGRVPDSFDWDRIETNSSAFPLQIVYLQALDASHAKRMRESMDIYFGSDEINKAFDSELAWMCAGIPRAMWHVLCVASVRKARFKSVAAVRETLFQLGQALINTAALSADYARLRSSSDSKAFVELALIAKLQIPFDDGHDILQRCRYLPVMPVPTPSGASTLRVAPLFVHGLREEVQKALSNLSGLERALLRERRKGDIAEDAIVHALQFRMMQLRLLCELEFLETPSLHQMLPFLASTTVADQVLPEFSRPYAEVSFSMKQKDKTNKQHKWSVLMKGGAGIRNPKSRTSSSADVFLVLFQNNDDGNVEESSTNQEEASRRFSLVEFQSKAGAKEITELKVIREVNKSALPPADGSQGALLHVMLAESLGVELGNMVENAGGVMIFKPGDLLWSKGESWPVPPHVTIAVPSPKIATEWKTFFSLWSNEDKP